MAEDINKALDKHSRTPKVTPYICVTASALKEIMNGLINAPCDTVVAVYEHAKNLDLPKSFKDELKFQCMKRGYMPELKS